MSSEEIKYFSCSRLMSKILYKGKLKLCWNVFYLILDTEGKRMKSLAKGIFSKICCLFTAALLIYSLVPVQAYAAPTSTNDVADSKVTITSLEPGDVVSAYLIAIFGCLSGF